MAPSNVVINHLIERHYMLANATYQLDFFRELVYPPDKTAYFVEPGTTKPATFFVLGQVVSIVRKKLDVCASNCFDPAP